MILTLPHLHILKNLAAAVFSVLSLSTSNNQKHTGFNRNSNPFAKVEELLLERLVCLVKTIG